MRDLKALEVAARAAGINYHHIDESGAWWRNGHMAERVYCWNPPAEAITAPAADPTAPVSPPPA